LAGLWQHFDFYFKNDTNTFILTPQQQQNFLAN